MLKEFSSAGFGLPQMLTLAITDDCNLTCAHCWVEACPQQKPVQAATTDLRRLLEEFASMGGEGIRLTGGEPLLHPDWLELLEFAFLLGYARVELQTNALLLTEREVVALEKIASPGLKVQISLDGATAKSHDEVRGSGTFARVMDKLQLLKKAGLNDRVSLFFTEMEHNLAEFPELLDLAADLGVGSVVSGTLILGGRAAVAGKVAPPAPHQYAALINRFRASSRFRELYASLGTMAALEWWLAKDVDKSCCSLAANPYVTPAGVLYPCALCHLDQFAIHGVYRRSFEDVMSEGLHLWPELQALANRRVEQIPECHSCTEKALCAGGCIGRAWGSCADMLAPDDRCEVRRLIGSMGAGK
jgi:radical SAM protein with 4Fe4S-binding SPASM domain